MLCFLRLYLFIEFVLMEEGFLELLFNNRSFDIKYRGSCDN